MVKKVRFSRKRRSRSRFRKNSLAKRVRRVEAALHSTLSTLKYKNSSGEQLLCSVNVQNVAIFSVNSRPFCETVLGQLRFFNPAVPGTLTTVDGSTGTYDRSYRMQSSLGLYIKNNFQIPCVIYIYKCWVQSNTGLEPQAAWAAASNDASNSTAITTIYQQDPMDCYDGIKDTWRVKLAMKKVLKPGQQITTWQKRPWIGYDPSEYDNHSYDYQRGFKSFVYMVRIHGVISHDATTTTNAGLAACGVDICLEQRATVKYNSGGPPIKYTYYGNSLDALAAGGLVSQVVVDNQQYSTT